jgi:hypothetical protein
MFKIDIFLNWHIKKFQRIPLYTPLLVLQVDW